MTIYDQIGAAAYSTRETQRNSHDMAQYVVKNNIPGAIVECGIAAGAQLATMMLALKDLGISKEEKDRRLFVGFDSFEGIQLAGPKDTSQPGLPSIDHDVNVPSRDLLKSSGVTVVSKKTVGELFNKWGLIDENRVGVCDLHLVEGWVQYSIPGFLNNKYCDFRTQGIAILRLDMDIYDPTKCALEYLYPLVSPGGVIIIDDWVLAGCRTACEEYFAENNITPTLMPIENSGPVYFFKP